MVPSLPGRSPGTAPAAWAWALALLLALSAAAGASDEARDRFLAAERHLDAGNRAAAAALMAELDDHPLLPYLEYKDLRARLDRPGMGPAVDDFLAAWPDSHLGGRLEIAWLIELFERGAWEDFLARYDGQGGTRMACRQIQALLQAGRREEALSQVRRVWLHGRSQPRECDPAFDAWRDAGRLTPELVWARVRLAMDEGEARLARYLARYLPAEQRPLVELWRAVRRDPRLAGRDSRFDPSDPRSREIRVYGLTRWAWRDPDAALAALESLEGPHALSDADSAPVRRAAGLRLFRLERYGEALAQLAGVPSPHTDARVRETRVLGAMLAGDWAAALRWHGALAPEERGEDRWRYWRARILAELGREDASREAFRAVAGERGYYGFLAADRLGASYLLNHRPLDLDGRLVERIERHPILARVAELEALGRIYDMRREWYHLLRTFAPREIEAAALLAHDHGWHFKAIWSLGRAQSWDEMEVRFPLAFREALESGAQARTLPPAWVYAIARQESAFAPDSRSPAGALGLMQLMPATARAVAARLGEGRPRRDDILDVTTNVRLGTSYLRELLTRLDEHPLLATAAYNAGPHRVRQWLPEQGPLAGDLWVETIPFRETRRYVRNVLAYTAIYEARLEAPSMRVAEWLGTVPSMLGRGQAALDAGEPRG